MTDTSISLTIFAIFFGTSVFCMHVRNGLPESHLNSDTKDAIRVGMALVATISALVLSLLITSTKATYDTERAEVTQMASKIIYLDRLLADFGPQADASRALLQQQTKAIIQRIKPEAKVGMDTVTGNPRLIDDLQFSVAKLKPLDDAQTYFKTQALAVLTDAAQVHWLMVEQRGPTIPMPLLIVVVVWLSVIFASIGLFAPMNPISTAGLLLAALSVAGAIFLILEFDRPFTGLIHISSEPMTRALHLISDP